MSTITTSTTKTSAFGFRFQFLFNNEQWDATTTFMYVYVMLLFCWMKCVIKMHNNYNINKWWTAIELNAFMNTHDAWRYEIRDCMKLKLHEIQTETKNESATQEMEKPYAKKKNEKKYWIRWKRKYVRKNAMMTVIHVVEGLRIENEIWIRMRILMIKLLLLLFYLKTAEQISNKTNRSDWMIMKNAL